MQPNNTFTESLTAPAALPTGARRACRPHAPQPPDHLRFRSEATDADTWAAGIDWSAPIDRRRWFICPTQTPLYYTSVYHGLDEHQQKRYNHLTALFANELITFMEQTFVVALESAARYLHQRKQDRDLVECIHWFVSEERRHILWWHQLNRLTEPAWYGRSGRRVMAVPVAVQAALDFIARHPRVFPAIFFFILMMEEHSIEMSKQTLRLPDDQVEPRYRAVYARHLEDEVRHVQVDWHLILRLYAPSPKAVRWLNAFWLRRMIGRYFVKPGRQTMRVVRLLASEDPGLQPLVPQIQQQLQQPQCAGDFQRVMFSRRTSPISFALFDRFEEMRAISGVLPTYRPEGG